MLCANVTTLFEIILFEIVLFQNLLIELLVYWGLSIIAVRPNFKMLATLASDFSLEKYTRGVYEELHMALRMNMNVRP